MPPAPARRPCPAVLALLVIPALAFARQPEKPAAGTAPAGFLTPEPADLPADLRKPGKYDAKYPIPQDPAKSKALRAGRLAWYRGMTVALFDKAGDTKAPWAAKARAALEATA